MSKYSRTKLLPKGLQIIQGVVRGKTFEITVYNKDKADYNEYKVSSATCNGCIPLTIKDGMAVLPQKELQKLDQPVNRIEVVLKQ